MGGIVKVLQIYFPNKKPIKRNSYHYRIEGRIQDLEYPGESAIVFVSDNWILFGR